MQEPPCADCKPDLLQENHPAFAIYQRCSGDWLRDAGGHITGLAVTAIETVMRVMQIDKKEQLHLLDQVQAIASAIMRELERERILKAEKK